MLPPLTTILKAAFDRNNQRVLEAAALATIPDIAASFMLGAAVGVTVAFIGSVLPCARAPIQRTALFLSTLPVIILAPVLVTTLGVDRVPLAIGALASFFPIFIAAAAGFSEAQPKLVDLISALGGGKVEQFRFVRWPSALLMIADGLQLSALYATFGVLFGQWFGTDRGLGVLLLTSMQNYQVELLWLTALGVTVFSNALALLIGIMSKLAVRSLV
jgi:NitT/TauT family transport system permease protein